MEAISNVLGDTIIDGVYASEATDKSAERIRIANCDISSLHAGEGTLIWEHKKKDESTPLDVVGSIVYAHKIFGPLDCQDERELYFWNLVQLPLIYGRARLYDGAGHDGARAVAAMIRDHYANHEKIVVRYSVDGSTLDRSGQELTHTICRHVAVTIQPCNQSCDTGLVSDSVLEGMGLLGKAEHGVAFTSMVLQCAKSEGPLVSDSPRQAMLLEIADQVKRAGRAARHALAIDRGVAR